MALNRNKLYTFLIIACAAGYIWLYFGLPNNGLKINPVNVCLIKHVTSIPCPSCGTTRSVISLTKGHFIEAFKMNPFGYVILLIMFLTPLWIAIDIATKQKTLFVFYQKMENHLRRPSFAIPLILLVIINWIWNITKGL
ncbi:MAG: DUF2752 domain-containing protein [Ginsengibacter sp.]